MHCNKLLGFLEPYAIETYGADYPFCAAGIICEICKKNHSSGETADKGIK